MAQEGGLKEEQSTILSKLCQQNYEVWILVGTSGV